MRDHTQLKALPAGSPIGWRMCMAIVYRSPRRSKVLKNCGVRSPDGKLSGKNGGLAIVTSQPVRKRACFFIPTDGTDVYGFGVKQSRHVSEAHQKRGVIVSRLIITPKRSPMVFVRWFVHGRWAARWDGVVINRLELSGPDRLILAAPELNPDDLKILMPNWSIGQWGPIDQLANQRIALGAVQFRSRYVDSQLPVS
jgi:hypothetical protein